MRGEYTSGDTSIVRDLGISTGQTGASDEQDDAGVSVVFVCGIPFGDESTQPALIISSDRVISTPAYIIFLDNGFTNLFCIGDSPHGYPKYQEIFRYDCLVVLGFLLF
jgi:hypothetical protein